MDNRELQKQIFVLEEENKTLKEDPLQHLTSSQLDDAL